MFLKENTTTLSLCEDNAFRLPADRLDDEVEDNIKCILERAELWDDDLSVSVSSIANDVSCDEETGQCMISQDFTVYKDNGWEDLAYGLAITTYYVGADKDYVDVARTYIVMPREQVEKLHDYVKMKKMIKA